MRVSHTASNHEVGVNSSGTMQNPWRISFHYVLKCDTCIAAINVNKTGCCDTCGVHQCRARIQLDRGTGQNILFHLNKGRRAVPWRLVATELNSTEIGIFNSDRTCPLRRQWQEYCCSRSKYHDCIVHFCEGWKRLLWNGSESWCLNRHRDVNDGIEFLQCVSYDQRIRTSVW